MHELVLLKREITFVKCQLCGSILSYIVWYSVVPAGFCSNNVKSVNQVQKNMQVYIANGVYSCAGMYDSVLQYSFVLFQGYGSYEVRYL
jgi:hypothetical protein